MAFFGQPQAYNQWFGNQLMIPETSQSPLMQSDPTQAFYPGFGQTPAIAPLAPPVPSVIDAEKSSREYEEQQLAGDNGPSIAGQSGAGEGYTSTEYDPNAPTFGESWDAVTDSPLGKIGGLVASGLTGGLPGLATNVATSFVAPAIQGIIGNDNPAAAATQAGLSVQSSNNVPSVDLDDYNKQFEIGNSMGHGSHAGAIAGPTVPDGTIAGSPAAGTDAAMSLAAEQQSMVAGSGAPQGPGRAPAHASIGTNLSVAEQDQAAADADGSGADGTVICTALHKHGLLPDEVFKADMAYGLKLWHEDPAVLIGYRLWATPIAKAIESSRTFAAIVAPIATPWAHHIAGNKTVIGAAYLKFGVPVCRMIGKAVMRRGAKQSVV